MLSRTDNAQWQLQLLMSTVSTSERDVRRVGDAMQLAKVLGQVVSTVKDSGLDSFKLLLVQDATGAGSSRTSGPVYVAVDLIGAGESELVLVTKGSAARVAPLSDKT